MTKVKAHAIAYGKYEYDKVRDIVGVPMHCEFPDGVIEVAIVYVDSEGARTLEKYFKSARGIDPVNLVV